MFKIGEFSKLAQVSVRMLRYYDEAGLLKPAETDRFTGYRLYSGEQILTLNKIIFLRDLHFNVSEIAVVLNNWDDGFIERQLEKKRLEIEAAIHSEREKLLRIERARKDIGQEKIEMHYNVSIKSIPGCRVLSLRRTVADYYAEGGLWKEMAAFAGEHGICVSSNTFTIYHDTDYREKDVDIEICAPVAQAGGDMGGFVFRNTEPVPVMACTMVHGGFENIAGAYKAFAGWLQEHAGYMMAGQTRQIVHRGPWNEEDPCKYLTEIQIPLHKAE